MAIKRYYDDHGSVDKSIDLRELSLDLHVLYTQWVAANGHRRDFTLAMEHAAELIYIEYTFAGKPSMEGTLPSRAILKWGVEPKVKADQPLRFYTEDCALSPHLDVGGHIPALAPHFVRWAQQELALRDFVLAVRDVCKTIVYDHEITLSMMGLGGGKDARTFMSTPYSC